MGMRLPEEEEPLKTSIYLSKEMRSRLGVIGARLGLYKFNSVVNAALSLYSSVHRVVVKDMGLEDASDKEFKEIGEALEEALDDAKETVARLEAAVAEWKEEAERRLTEAKEEADREAERRGL